MIPFPGESVGIDYAFAYDGVTFDETLYDSIRRRGGIGSLPATRTVTPAAQWRAYVYPGSQTYLEDAGTPVVVSWVVEVAGGSGTLVASAGLDPDYGSETAPHPIDLGAHAITGATTLVLPTSLTAADVMSGADAMMLVLDVTAGSVDVQQVKLRVWPPGGALGGWSDTLPGWSMEAPPEQALVHNLSWVASNLTTDPLAEWEVVKDTQAPLDDTGPPRLFSVVDLASSGAGSNRSNAHGTILKETLTEYRVSASTNASIAVLVAQDPASLYPVGPDLVEGVDYTRPPEEVADDRAALAQRFGTGSVAWTETVAPVIIGGVEMYLGHPLGGGYSTDTLDITPSGSDYLIDVEMGPTTSLGSHASGIGNDTATTLDLGLTGGRYAVITADHTFRTGDSASWSLGLPGLSSSVSTDAAAGIDTSGVRTVVTSPGYRVWLPAVATVEPLRLMQRGDWLGMGSGRVFGVGTRQASTRVFGSL